jgi:hypothetical protein
MMTFLTIPPAAVDLNVDADTSWCAVLNYAHQHGLQFGTDLVFTYGPLGYLIAFYFSPNGAGMRMVADVALCWTVAAGLCLVAWRLRPVWRCLLVGVFVFVAANIPLRSDLVIDTGFLCWGLLCFVESGRRLAFSVLTLTALAVFGALAKTTYIFMAGLSVGLLAGGLAARGHRRLGLAMVAGIVVGLPLVWIAAGQNLWHLGSYFVNALTIVQGYNQAMGWEGLSQVVQRGILVVVAGIAMVFIRSWTACEGRDKRVMCRRGLLFAWLSSLLFLLWKHGFVRGDSYHVVYFFGFLPLLALALEVLPCERRAARLWAGGLTAVCCLLSLSTLQSLYFPDGFRSLQRPFQAFGYNTSCLLRPAAYWQRMNDIVDTKRREASLPRFREIIGRAGVDVFGHQQIYALLNDLNYRPRPVFQSYAAGNPQLMRLNEQFYLSEAAPEYVIFTLGGIDRRFAPLQDALVLRDLLINYAPADAERGFLLLKFKSSASPRLRLLCEGTAHPGSPIDLRGFPNTNLWLEIGLEPTLLGRSRQFFYRPSTVRLAAWREPGKGLLIRRRSPAAMLSAGFFASPLLLSDDDVLKCYSGDALPRPGAYSVELLPGEKRFWQNTIRFRVSEISPAKGS